MRATRLSLAAATTLTTLVALGVAGPPASAATMLPGAVDAMSAKPAPPLQLVPPLDGSTPPHFERAGCAAATLRAHGLRDIRGLARVGDYWEAEGFDRGRRVVAYLLADGTLEIRHATRAATARTFGGAG